MKKLLLITTMLLITTTVFAKPLFRPTPSSEQQSKDMRRMMVPSSYARSQYLQRRYERRYGIMADFDYYDQTDEEWERQQQLDEIENQLDDLREQQQQIQNNRRIIFDRQPYEINWDD